MGHEEEIDDLAKNGEMVRQWLKGGVPSKGSFHAVSCGWLASFRAGCAVTASSISVSLIIKMMCSNEQ